MPYDYDRLSSEDVDEETLNVDTGFGRSTYGALAEGFHGVFRIFFAGRRWTDRFENKLAGAGISTTADTWLSGAFAIGSIVGGAVAFLFLLVAAVGLLPLSAPHPDLSFLPVPAAASDVVTVVSVGLSWMFYGFVGATLGVLGGGGIAVIYPYSKARQRRQKIDEAYPDAIAFMHSLSVTGMGQLDIFRATADAEDVYSEFSVEIQRIIHKVEHMDSDFNQAVKSVAQTTPSSNVEAFLTGMLSQLGAGGDLTRHLEEAKRQAHEARERDLESISQQLQVLGQSYMTFTILPMMLIIVLVLVALFGDPQILLLATIVYLLTPLINLIYGLMVSSLKVNEVGDGYISMPDGSVPGKVTGNPFEFETVESYLGEHPVFGHIYLKEAQAHLTEHFVHSPVKFFVNYPRYLFVLTVPITFVGWGLMYASGLLTLSVSAMISDSILQTFLWFFWPLIAVLIPYTTAYEYREWKRSGVMDTLEQDFRALANINEQGQPLPEAMRVIARDGDSLIADEFGIMYKKRQLGTPMKRSLAEFNNKYHIPRLARQLKILEKAQEVSTHIGEVLETAAETAEYHNRVMKNRASKLKTQLLIVQMGFLVFLLIMAGMNYGLIGFVNETVGGSGAEFIEGDPADPELLSMFFFHGALIQGLFSGIVAGYIRSGDASRGLKYGIANVFLVLLVFVSLPVILGAI